MKELYEELLLAVDRRHCGETTHDTALRYIKMYPKLAIEPLSNTPLSNTPLSNTPLSNTPLSNTPLSNTPLSNTPLSNTPLSNTIAQVAAEGGVGVDSGGGGYTKHSQVLITVACDHCDWYANAQRTSYELTYGICPQCGSPTNNKIRGKYIYNMKNKIIGFKRNG